MTGPTDFISVGDLGRGFEADSHILPTVDDLAGRSFELDFDGTVQSLQFDDGGSVSWPELAEPVPARVTSLRSGLYLVNATVEPTHWTFVLDLDAGRCTRVEGALPDAATATQSAFERVQRGEDATGVTASFSFGTIAGVPGDAPLHGPTSDLVGLRNRYTYSPTEQYEHIYLNDNRYTWHCLHGVEAGLADTDQCHTVLLRPRLYLFVWREKIVPTLGVILIDLEKMKTDGVIFGNDSFDSGSFTTFPVGAVTEILNRTTY